MVAKHLYDALIKYLDRPTNQCAVNDANVIENLEFLRNGYDCDDGESTTSGVISMSQLSAQSDNNSMAVDSTNAVAAAAAAFDDNRRQSKEAEELLQLCLADGPCNFVYLYLSFFCFQ